MSRIGDLGEKQVNLVQVLSDYEKDLDDVKEKIEIKGKKLEHANRENPAWQHYYDARRAELKTLLKYMEAQVNRVRGNLFKSYTENMNRDLSDRAKDKYIDNEPAYLNMYELFLEVEELYNKYNAVVEAFTTRGYALNNITKIRVAAIEDAIV